MFPSILSSLRDVRYSIPLRLVTFSNIVFSDSFTPSAVILAISDSERVFPSVLYVLRRLRKLASGKFLVSIAIFVSAGASYLTDVTEASFPPKTKPFAEISAAAASSRSNVTVPLPFLILETEPGEPANSV